MYNILYCFAHSCTERDQQILMWSADSITSTQVISCRTYCWPVRLTHQLKEFTSTSGKKMKFNAHIKSDRKLYFTFVWGFKTNSWDTRENKYLHFQKYKSQADMLRHMILKKKARSAALYTTIHMRRFCTPHITQEVVAHSCLCK